MQLILIFSLKILRIIVFTGKKIKKNNKQKIEKRRKNGKTTTISL
jgi:hypothetical protein